MSTPSLAPDVLARHARREALVRQYTFTFADTLTQHWFDHSGFANFGYWDGATTAAEASMALVDRLVAMIPGPDPRGRVLDVACGGGGTTKRLTTHFDATGIVGINIGDDQLARARRAVPGVTFQLMDAVDLQFEAASFDVVVCVEAAHHFETRARFLAEAFRVLRPGGWLLMSDVLCATGLALARDLRLALLCRLPPRHALDFVPANTVSNLESYEDLFRLAGFGTVALDDAIDRTWRAFHQRQRRYLMRAALADPRLIVTTCRRLRTFAIWDTVIHAYPLVAAQKPAAFAGRPSQSALAC